MSETGLQLLARYTSQRSEEAFAEVVRRHLDLVHSILDKQTVSDSETHLRIESIGASNETPVLEQWAKMIKIGSEWKFEGWVGNEQGVRWLAENPNGMDSLAFAHSALRAFGFAKFLSPFSQTR